MSDHPMAHDPEVTYMYSSSAAAQYDTNGQPEAGPSRLRVESGSPIPEDLLEFQVEDHPHTQPSPPPEEPEEDPHSHTGYVYDVRMTAHVELVVVTDQPGPRHPERPERITGIHKALIDGGCLTRMKKIKIREVTKAEIDLVHNPGHWEKVLLIASCEPEDVILSKIYYENLSLYINPNTPLCASLSTGGVIETVRAVMDSASNIRNAFAIVRPPGHHAEPNEHMGFCFFNNVAVAARAIQKELDRKIRIVIIDWDVHHGNGTQKAFYDDPSILYISVHRYDSGDFYPSMKDGSNQACGVGEGIGRNVNIGWEKGGKGDADYIYAFQKIIIPICYEFAPELVLVSAGFDAARGDPLGGCDVTPAGYQHMLHMLKGLAGGKVVVALEGGYNIDAISVSALACAQVLLGDPPAMLEPMQASDSATQTVHEVAQVQSNYWKSISPKSCEPRESYRDEEDDVTHNLSELLAAHRADHLYKSYRLCNFPLVVPDLERLFPNAIQCSENVLQAKTVILFVHDLATLKLMGYDTLHVNVQDELSYIVDTTDLVLKWVMSENPSLGLGRGQPVGLIDVNLPSIFPSDLDPHTGNAIKTAADIKKTYQQLLEYVWDNLLDLKPESTNLILIGNGTGCEALMGLTSKRAVEQKTLAFVQVHGLDAPLKMLDASKREWFNRVSLRFTPKGHPVHDEAKRKNYGTMHISHQSEPLLVLKSALPQIKAFVAEKLYPEEAAALEHLPEQMAGTSL